jgi:tetratricopeptide (TPR) repeat protein
MNKYVLISFVWLFQNFYYPSFSQSDYKSEEALIKAARDFYLSGKYADAAPLYTQLVSTHPDNAVYHLNYGISLLNAFKNKAEAVYHLQIADGSNEISEDVDYYLAKAYHLNYEFEKAIERLEIVSGNSKENKELKQAAGFLISLCKNARQFNFDTSGKFIITREETTEDNAFGFYNFDNYSGRFLAMPGKFIKGKNNKGKFSKYVFLSSSGNALVFSGPGKSNTTELFISRKRSGNDWDDAEPVKFKSMLAGDKSTPVISAEGDTIYFSWNGTKSMGGYDVFKSVYNPDIHLWSEPENMGPPVNSVFDDFNYLPSAEGDFAYVCSSRDCDEGKIYVLKISSLLKFQALQNK